jgi:hypothetical protein
MSDNPTEPQLSASFIYKYPIPAVPGPFELTLTKYAVVLDVQAQHDRPVLWAVVDPSNASEARRFVAAYTGDEFMAPRFRHVGTLQLYGGDIVLHVFEVP